MRDEYNVFCGTGEYFPPEWYNKGVYRPGPLCVWQLGCLLYILLVGSIPYEKDEISEAIRDEKYEKHLSWEASDAINQMLNPDETKRVSLETILDLPFFNGSRVKDEVSSLSSLSSEESSWKVLYLLYLFIFYSFFVFGYCTRYCVR